MDDNTSTYAFESSMNLGENFDYKAKGNSYATTDKIKVYVTSNDKLREEADNVSYKTYGYTLTKGDKKDTFKLDEKSKEISAKLDKEGNITLTAKKGAAKGTTAKLLYVATHQDKTIDVYEASVSVGGEDVKIKPVILCDEKYKESTIKTNTTRSFDVSIRNPQEGAVLSVKCDDINIATASVSGNTVKFKGGSANGVTMATLSYIIPATEDKEAVVLATRSFIIRVVSKFEAWVHGNDVSQNKVAAYERCISVNSNFEIEKLEVAKLVDNDGLIESYEVGKRINFIPSGKTEGTNPVFTINAYYDGKVVATFDVEVLFDV